MQKRNMPPQTQRCQLAWMLLGKKLSEYYTFTDSTPVYVCAVSLNPHLRLHYFQRRWIKRPEWIATAKAKITTIYAEYQEEMMKNFVFEVFSRASFCRKACLCPCKLEIWRECIFDRVPKWTRGIFGDPYWKENKCRRQSGSLKMATFQYCLGLLEIFFRFLQCQLKVKEYSAGTSF